MKSPLAPTALLLAASGACALVYQVTWFRELRLVFGAAGPASAAVLAIFMGGLGLGNALLGRRADQSRRPLALYAGLEAAIAISAALSPFLIDFARGLYIAWGGSTSLGSVGAVIVRLALATLILLVPTVLMGGTLPAAAAAVTTADDPRRSGTAVLYSANTLGAVLGAALATFLLIPALGTRTALWSACIVNLLAAGAAWSLSRQTVNATHPRTKSRPVVQETGPTLPASLVYLAAAVTGGVYMLMEIIWYRMLSPLLGGTTYTFGLILAVALLGIGVGGALFPLLVRRRAADREALAITFSLEACLLALPFALGDRLAIAAARMQEANEQGFAGSILIWSLIAAVVVFPASVVSGIQFPLLISLLGRGDEQVGKQIGWAYACNTLGGIAGSLAGGFGLLPLLSAPGVWRLSVSVLALGGIALVIPSRGRLAAVSPRAWMTLGAVLGATWFATFPGPTAVWRHSGIGAGRSRLPDPLTANSLQAWTFSRRREVVWEGDGVEAGVALVAENGLAFYVNGKSDGNAVSDAPTQIGLGLLPAALHPSPKTSLVIGLGTGETAGFLGRVDGMERVDVVEIEPAIAIAAELCASVNSDVLANPKVRIVYDDAREILLTSRDRYDIIASEPSNPYRAGIASLFTRECYLAARQRLKPGGIFVQWLQNYEIDETTVHTVLATLQAVFPRVEIWQSKRGDLLLVCSAESRPDDRSHLASRLQSEPFRTALAQVWRADSLAGFFARFVARAEFVEELTRRLNPPLNTDDFNRIEFGFARMLGRRADFDLQSLRAAAVAAEQHRPVGEFENLSWSEVEDEQATMSVVRLTDVAAADESKDPAAARRLAWGRYAAGDFPGVVAAWNKQSKPATTINEVARLAMTYAVLGDARAEPLLERVRSRNVTEALLIGGVLDHNRSRPDVAITQFVAAFEGLRTDPWPLVEVADVALRTAATAGSRDPIHGQKLLVALDRPFAAYFLEEKRRATACLIAASLSPQAALPWVESYEPEPLWNDAFLHLRAQVYGRTGDPRASAARADLDRFRRNER